MNKVAKIVIASVLKPIDDVRNFEKLAMTIAKEKKHQVIVMGTAGVDNSEHNIECHAWKPFKRLSVQRFLIQGQFWTKLKQKRPDVVIVTTHEMLITAVLFKLVYRTKIIYDVQEDYFRNLWYQQFYPPVLKHVVGLMIRFIEWSVSPFVSVFFLAESIYKEQIPFTRKRGSVIENKAFSMDRSASSGFTVLFTGTLSHYSQAIESIELFLNIKEDLPESKMIVIGYAPKRQYREKLKKFESEIELIVSNEPVEHSKIIDQICRADLAIIGYEPNPINRSKIPTKLYEYTAAKLPYLVRANTHWAKVGHAFGGAIPVDYSDPDCEKMLDEFKNVSDNSFAKSGYLWDEQEDTIRRNIQNLLLN